MPLGLGAEKIRARLQALVDLYVPETKTIGWAHAKPMKEALNKLWDELIPDLPVDLFTAENPSQRANIIRVYANNNRNDYSSNERKIIKRLAAFEEFADVQEIGSGINPFLEQLRLEQQQPSQSDDPFPDTNPDRFSSRAADSQALHQRFPNTPAPQQSSLHSQYTAQKAPAAAQTQIVTSPGSRQEERNQQQQAADINLIAVADKITELLESHSDPDVQAFKAHVVNENKIEIRRDVITSDIGATITKDAGENLTMTFKERKLEGPVLESLPQSYNTFKVTCDNLEEAKQIREQLEEKFADNLDKLNITFVSGNSHITDLNFPTDPNVRSRLEVV